MQLAESRNFVLKNIIPRKEIILLHRGHWGERERQRERERKKKEKLERERIYTTNVADRNAVRVCS